MSVFSKAHSETNCVLEQVHYDEFIDILPLWDILYIHIWGCFMQRTIGKWGNRHGIMMVFLLFITGITFAQTADPAVGSRGGVFPFPFQAKDIYGNDVNQSFWGEKEYFFIYHTATWCGPCVQGMPALAGVAREFGDRVGFLALLDDYRNNLSGAIRITENAGIPSNFIFIDARLEGVQNILALVRRGSIPAAVIIDRNGNRLTEPFHTARARTNLNSLFSRR
jgi:thiol-disulfide isomerase/thioredoxin